MKNLKYPRKKIIEMAVMVVIICLMQFQIVQATTEPVPNTDRDVTLQVHLETKEESKKGTTVKGGVIKLYLVAEIDCSHGNLKYRVLPNYKEAENELLTGEYIKAASKCKKVAESINPDMVLKTGEDGNTERMNLGKRQGLYLILTEDFPERFQEAMPSIVAIPGYIEEDNNAHWVYDMMIIPKIEISGHESTTIPKTSENSKPKVSKTDDPQNPRIYLTLIAISIMGIIATKRIKDSVE